jgi:hypothetical protein
MIYEGLGDLPAGSYMSQRSGVATQSAKKTAEACIFSAGSHVEPSGVVSCQVVKKAMRQLRCQVYIETSVGRKPAGLRAFLDEEPAHIALQIREKGLVPYRVRFDPNGGAQDAGAWVVSVIDWKRAA